MDLSKVNNGIKIIIATMVEYNEKDVRKGILLSLPALRKENPKLNQLNLSNEDIILLYQSDVAEVLLTLINRGLK